MSLTREPVSDTESDSNIESELRGEVHLARHRVARYAYIAGGSVALALGVAGLLLPIVPTTPFLLLAAYCYARGSAQVYYRLMTNRFFGAYLRAWRDNEGLPLGVKVYVIVLLWVVLGPTIVFIVPLLAVRILLAVIGIGVTVYIAQLPTARSR